MAGRSSITNLYLIIITGLQSAELHVQRIQIGDGVNVSIVMLIFIKSSDNSFETRHGEGLVVFTSYFNIRNCRIILQCDRAHKIIETLDHTETISVLPNQKQFGQCKNNRVTIMCIAPWRKKKFGRGGSVWFSCDVLEQLLIF